MPNARLLPAAGGVALQCDYHGELVQEIKNLPYSDRRWDKPSRSWIIAQQHVDLVARLVEMHLGVSVQVPQAPAASVTPEIKMVRLEYLGRCKDRGAGENTATGYADGAWSLVFPEAVLKTWFSASEPSEPDKPKTLYQVLGVPGEADAQAIKKAYRQLARQWHPDVCREPDASEQFQRIQHAYEILGDDLTRRKYEVGLRLEASSQEAMNKANSDRMRGFFGNGYGSLNEYRAPLRCGWLLVEGSSRIGQFIVSKILRWEDIQRDDGKTMVSSWPIGAQMFVVSWA